MALHLLVYTREPIVQVLPIAGPPTVVKNKREREREREIEGGRQSER